MRLILLFILTIIFIGGCNQTDEEPQQQDTYQISQETEEPSPQQQEQESIQQSEIELESSDMGDFKVIYEQTTNPDYAGYELLFKSTQTFELLTQELNNLFILSRDIPVALTECETPNAFYDPNSGQIVMCYELIDHLAEVFNLEELSNEEYNKAIIDTWIFIFYHEVGHALVDVYDLPIVGREEDAVDQFATLILTIGQYEDAALNGAVFFLLNTQNTDLQNLAFWDEHSLDEQRFYNIFCWVYGSNPQGNLYIFKDGYLPEERAIGCKEEYTRMSNSWDTLLADYIKE